MTSTDLPLPRDLIARAVQGYGPKGRPRPAGAEQENFVWPALARSIRRRATWPRSWPRTWVSFPSIARLGGHGSRPTGRVRRQPALQASSRLQIIGTGNLTIIDKNGGLPSTSTYIGFGPQQSSRRRYSRQPRQAARHRESAEILHALAQDQSAPSSQGAEPNPDAD